MHHLFKPLCEIMRVTIAQAVCYIAEMQWDAFILKCFIGTGGWGAEGGVEGLGLGRLRGFPHKVTNGETLPGLRTRPTPPSTLYRPEDYFYLWRLFLEFVAVVKLSNGRLFHTTGICYNVYGHYGKLYEFINFEKYVSQSTYTICVLIQETFYK